MCSCDFLDKGTGATPTSRHGSDVHEPRRPSRAPTGRPRSQAARVYMVTQQAADATPDVVTGTISLFDTDAHVLVDSGATILLFLGSS